jgi:hypothetical protein
MSIIWKLKKWLKPISPETRVDKKVLVRHEAYKFSYRKWLNTSKKEDILNRLHNSFMLRQLGVAGETPIHYNQTRKSHSLLIHYIDMIGKDQFSFLFDYLKDRTIKLGYHVYAADKQTVEREGFTDSMERYVLKPAVHIFSVNEKASQLYGQITLYNHIIDGRPVYIRLLIEHLDQNSFEKPHLASDLIEFVLA